VAKGQVATDRLYAALAPAVDRSNHTLDDDEQDRFRDALGRFLRIYAFLSQVVAFTDSKLERDYLYDRASRPSSVTTATCPCTPTSS
jgi:type I restriction enzyme, R subunit